MPHFLRSKVVIEQDSVIKCWYEGISCYVLLCGRKNGKLSPSNTWKTDNVSNEVFFKEILEK